MSTMLPDAMKV